MRNAPIDDAPSRHHRLFAVFYKPQWAHFRVLFGEAGVRPLKVGKNIFSSYCYEALFNQFTFVLDSTARGAFDTAKRNAPDSCFRSQWSGRP